MTDSSSVIGSPTHLIFDCDGVLVDSEAIAIRVEEVRLAEAGFAVTAAEIAERFVGLSYASMAAQLETQFGQPLPDSLLAAVQVETMERFPSELEEVPGVGKVLAESSLPRCVASSSDLDRIRLSLELTNLAPMFEDDLVFSAQMVENGKPAPDLFLFAANQMGADPKNCVVIEDSPHGVAAGVAAGMPVIGLTAGGHATPALAQRLLDAGAATVVATTADLAATLRDWVVSSG